MRWILKITSPSGEVFTAKRKVVMEIGVFVPILNMQSSLRAGPTLSRR